MAALLGSLFLVWAVLNLLCPEVEGSRRSNPCEQQHRTRVDGIDVGNPWGPTVFFAVIILFGMFLCLPSDIFLCIQDQSGQVPCEDTPEDTPRTPTQVGLSSCQSRCCSRSLRCAEDKETYSQKLKSMEKLLDAFLNEVRRQKQALEKVLGKNVAIPCVDLDNEPLTITVCYGRDSKNPILE